MKKLLLISLLCIGCKDSTYYREKHGQIQEYTVDYVIQSIRVDDDSEYHVVAVSSHGGVKTLSDLDPPYDVTINYGSYNKPILKVTISDRCCGKGNMVEWGKPQILLPFNYQIETFDD